MTNVDRIAHSSGSTSSLGCYPVSVKGKDNYKQTVQSIDFVHSGEPKLRATLQGWPIPSTINSTRREVALNLVLCLLIVFQLLTTSNPI
ncbi:hypothetical protein ABES58_07485 [Paenibacillus lautus]|uniref:hypothetical protein n=1 Tax=Paenibacillus lautus TaxID=1401 RepID=UPI003D2E6420